MRIPKYTPHLLAIQHLMDGRCIRLVASRRKILLAEPTLTARDNETVHNAISDFSLGNFRPNLLDDTAEFVAEDVSLFRLDNDAVQEMHVTSADSGASDSYKHIVVLDELGLADVLYAGIIS